MKTGTGSGTGTATGTSTSSSARALEAMLVHHAALADGVARRVAALRSAVDAGAGHQTASAELVAYLAGDVLAHALAEEHTIYPAAAAEEELAAPVAGMIEEHRQLASLVEDLAVASDGPRAVSEADAIAALFEGHVRQENEIVLPRLAADNSADLPGLLADMHRLIEPAQRDMPGADADAGAGAGASVDTEASLLRLLIDAAGQLAAGGQGEEACRLAAEAWVAVRATRPDLGARVTAALHRLVRSATAEPVTLSSGPRAPSGVPVPSADAMLDVRDLAPAQRHERIFATYGALDEGAAFVLVNDHDPKPLGYQFEAEHSGRYSWDYLEAGPKVWRVRIGKLAQSDR